MTDAELLARLEAGAIPNSFLWRNKEDAISTDSKAGEWEWYDLENRVWLRGPGFRECCEQLFHAQRTA